MTKSLEEHAENWDLRHDDFRDNDFLYDVYEVMRRNAPFAHTDTPFLSATPGGAWVATIAGSTALGSHSANCGRGSLDRHTLM